MQRLEWQRAQRMAVDSKAIGSAGKPVTDEAKQQEPDGRRDLDADSDKKTYRDRVMGFELHFIRGMAKMKARVTTALAVRLAMALGRIRADQKQQMRSLVAPVRAAA